MDKLFLRGEGGGGGEGGRGYFKMGSTYSKVAAYSYERHPSVKVSKKLIDFGTYSK